MRKNIGLANGSLDAAQGCTPVPNDLPDFFLQWQVSVEREQTGWPPKKSSPERKRRFLLTLCPKIH